jgi:hypothetical protein
LIPACLSRTLSATGSVKVGRKGDTRCLARTKTCRRFSDEAVEKLEEVEEEHEKRMGHRGFVTEEPPGPD